MREPGTGTIQERKNYFNDHILVIMVIANIKGQLHISGFNPGRIIVS